MDRTLAGPRRLARLTWIIHKRSSNAASLTAAEYFSKDERPFSESPSVAISQSVAQSTDVRVTMALEIQEAVVQKLADPDITPEQRSFLEKLKPALATGKSAIELLRMVLDTARSEGVGLSSLTDVFS